MDKFPLMKSVNEFDKDHEQYVFYCPACRHAHVFIVKWGPKCTEARKKSFVEAKIEWTEPPQWSFNGNMEKPTFHPSLLNKITPSQASGKPIKICHLHITDGEIRYCADCTHEYAGKTVPLPKGD